MVVAQQPVVINVVWYLLIAFSPLLLFWVVLRAPRWLDAAQDRRAVRLRATRPHGHPLERLVADLRRLRTELINDPPNNNIRRTALLLAYDSVLKDTCERLQLPTALDVTAPGQEREFERLRAEAAIQEAGIPLHEPRRRAQP